MRHRKVVGVLGFAAVAAFLLMGAVAWACVPTATLNVAPGHGIPGDTIQLTGASYGKNPVAIHFGALDGPVVATITPVGGALTGSFVIPDGTAPGNYVLVATENAQSGTQLWGIPVRALVGVGSANQPAPPLAAAALPSRASGLSRTSASHTGALVLAGIGGAGLALLVAGLGTFLASPRRRSATESVASES
ncbi:MAG: hypothetical protein ACRDZ8_16125 [Acidimicrobiales bacterium]